MIRNALLGLAISLGAILAILLCLGFGPTDIARMFAHPVQGGVGLAVAEDVAPIQPQGPAETKPFGTVNLLVLAAYLALMLGVGLACGRRVQSARGFFIAEGRMNHVVVGLSILGTYLSALTMMGLPGMAYGKHDWTYMVQLPFLVITAVVVTRFVLPHYRKTGTASIYTFLEERIGASVRMIAAGSFIVFAIGRMGLVLYLPALAFNTVTGVPLPTCIIVMGIVITIYTVIGGIEAVVWTDAIQVVIFVLGAFVTLGFIFSDLGVEQFLAIGLEHNKFRIVEPSLDLTRITSLWLILETLFQTIRIYGTQQDVAQRYMTTRSTEDARRSIWIGIIAYIPIGFIFYFIGTALFAFYTAHPEIGLPGKADPIYPFFVVNQLPAGVAGLVIAAIFAAAMSSIDSAMNSASTVCVEDFWQRFAKQKATDQDVLAVARRLTLLWGILAILMGLAFMETEYAQILWGKLMAVTTNGVLGLIALALIPIRIRASAALIGFLAATAGLYLMMRTEINFLLWPVIGNTTGFLVALGVNALRGPREGRA
ncbi:MAG: sodium/solute symporter [Verrucomicrobia bacterium]|nr:sodium/solute symporter [Verrucomicrobiota bacterium]MDA1085969.1 sodium/solute symporter [Verrucomicrobiota bacterium]